MIKNVIVLKKRFFKISCFVLFFIPLSAAAQDMAYPIQGDGIYSFLRRWNRLDSTYVREFVELNRDRLNARGGLELGTVYLIPPLHPGDVYPPKPVAFSTFDPALFGSAYADVPKNSDKLKNACFYIESGHGGPDPGAVSNIDGIELHEDEYAYDIALRLARNLMAEGATVYMIIQDQNDGIRDDKFLNNSYDETCLGKPIPGGQLDRLKQRVNAVNKLYREDRKKFDYLRAIAIHVDSRNETEQIDVFFYHSDNPKSIALAKTMSDVFQQKYDQFQPWRGFQGVVGQRDLYVIRNYKPASILVEVGNIQNDFDRRRIILENNRQAMANWMTLGFIKDYEHNLTK